jgi:hypothetical protein
MIAMKTSLLLSAALICLLTACSKQTDDDTLGVSLVTVTADDAAIITQYYVSDETGGLTTLLTDVSALAYNRNNASYCGKSKDSTVTKAKTTPPLTYNYSQAWNWTLNCSVLKLPANLTYKTTLTGTYTTRSVSSTDQGTGNLVVSGLEPAVGSYGITGSYTRDGSQTVTGTSGQKALTSSLSATLTNLLVSKSTLQVQSGQAAFTLTGKTTAGRSFSYSGTVTFNGNGSATISVGGKTITVTI